MAEGWKSLFNGETLDGWFCRQEEHGWTVEDGCIFCANPMGRNRYLYTVEQYENYCLQVEFKYEAKANSGIFVRLSNVEDPVNTGIEIQVFDSYGSEEITTHTNGAIYDLVPPRINASKPAGEWNNAEITCEGPILKVSMNGEELAAMDMSNYTEAGKNPDGSKNKFAYAWAEMPRKGHIALQDHNSKVWFRNIRLKEL